MDKLGKKIIKIKTKSKRRGQSFKKKTLNIRNIKTKKIIEKIKKEGLTTNDLLRFLSGSPNFLGVFPSDQIPSVIDSHLPIFFIVNIDSSKLPGSHWISFRIDASRIEIFDSLGFNPERWNNFPSQIINFLLRYINTHKFYGTPRLQDENSFTCGAFCIYFILSRKTLSFSQSLQVFSSNYSENDLLVLEKIKKFF